MRYLQEIKLHKIQGKMSSSSKFENCLEDFTKRKGHFKIKFESKDDIYKRDNGTSLPSVRRHSAKSADGILVYPRIGKPRTSYPVTVDFSNHSSSSVTGSNVVITQLYDKQYVPTYDTSSEVKFASISAPTTSSNMLHRPVFRTQSDTTGKSRTENVQNTYSDPRKKLLKRISSTNSMPAIGEYRPPSALSGRMSVDSDKVDRKYIKEKTQKTSLCSSKHLDGDTTASPVSTKIKSMKISQLAAFTEINGTRINNERCRVKDNSSCQLFCEDFTSNNSKNNSKKTLGKNQQIADTDMVSQTNEMEMDINALTNGQKLAYEKNCPVKFTEEIRSDSSGIESENYHGNTQQLEKLVQSFQEDNNNSINYKSPDFVSDLQVQRNVGNEWPRYDQSMVKRDRVDGNEKIVESAERAKFYGNNFRHVDPVTLEKCTRWMDTLPEKFSGLSNCIAVVYESS